MATPLDIGLLANFQILFPFLFIFSLVFGLLISTKFLGDNRALQAIIALTLAFMSLFSDLIVETINTAAPWFVLLVVFLVFLLLGFMILGVKEADISSVLKNPDYGFLSWWMVALILIIVLGSLSHVISEQKGGFGPGAANISVDDDGRQLQETQEGDFWQTLFHPKVLGMVVLLLVAFFTVSKLASRAT